MNKKRYNKTYAKKPTKREEKKDIFKIQMALLITALVVGLIFIGRAYFQLVDTIEETAKSTKVISSDELQFIKVSEAKEKKTKEKEMGVKEKIKKVFKEQDRQEWINYGIKLAYCESRLDPKATNKKGNDPAHSVDRGIYQFNSYWQPHVSDECAFDVECSTKHLIKMIEAGKQHRWVCDDYVKGVPMNVVMNK